MAIEKISVIGSGTMGNGITHVAAQHGYKVWLIDIAQEFLDRAKATITKNLGRQVSKEKITQADADTTLANITFTTSWDDVGNSDFVVEAVTENKDVKLEIFKKLDEKVPEHVILATNTSTISITEIAAATTEEEVMAIVQKHGVRTTGHLSLSDEQSVVA